MSINQTFTIEEEIIHHLMLQAVSLKENGLFYGKLGISIAIAKYGKYCNNHIYIDYSKELINDILSNIDEKTSFDFATGLCGIVWGIEYVVQNQFIDNNYDDICEYFDKIIITKNLRRITDISLESGLEGFLHYVLIRQKSAKIKKNKTLFDDDYMKDVYHSLHFFPNSSFKKIFISFVKTDSITYNPNLSLFVNDLNINDLKDIASANLGLANGLAGKLVGMVK